MTNNIKPLGNKIQLKIEEEKIGAIQSESIQEKGTIIAVGKSVEHKIPLNKERTEFGMSQRFPIGATLYFKAWAIDIITDGEEKYYFISADSDAICAVKYND